MRENLHSKCMCFSCFISFWEKKPSQNVNNSLMKRMFNSDVVLSKMSDSTFAMILISKA